MKMYNAVLWVIRRLIRPCAIGPGIFLACLSIGYAADVCDQPADHSYLAIGYYDYGESDIGSDSGVDHRRTRFDTQFAGSETWTFGVRHRYDRFGFDPVELQTNGHLHSLSFPLHWQGNSKNKGFRISLSPALIASSNVIDEPGEYSSDAFQLLAALIWSAQLSDETTFSYGLCGDTRFGEYALYPSISIRWRLRADWTIELGFPTSRLSYRANRDVSSSLRIAPDGNEWYVKDKGLQEESKFVYEAILLEWTIDWQLHERLTVMGGVGRQFDVDYEVTLLDGGPARLSADPTTRIGAALAWRF